MDPVDKHDTQQAVTGVNTGRNYGGVRITRPPSRARGDSDQSLEQLAAEFDQTFSNRSFGRSHQARILTGSALFGVIVSVLLHEFGHWLSGVAVTGMAPDFLLVAVRQKTSDFSTIGGIVTWGSGPLLHTAALWVAIIFVTSRSCTHPRLFAATGGALVFALFAHSLNWIGATFTSPDSWGNDLPRVATFFGSWAVFWMHFLSLAFMAAILLPAYVWITAARSTGTQSLYLTPALLGAVQGGILVLIVTFFVSLSQ